MIGREALWNDCVSTPQQPIYGDCRRLLVHTEVTVRRFSRFHKYTGGTDLHQAAMAIMRTAHQAVYDQPRQASHVHVIRRPCARQQNRLAPP